MVVTDLPDPLADLTRRLAGHDRVFSTGTLIDSLRFRVHLADRLRVRPRDVQAMVVGEHGTSEVLLWSSASVGGIRALDLLGQDGESVEQLKQQIEKRHPLREHHHHRGHRGQPVRHRRGVGAAGRGGAARRARRPAGGRLRATL